MVNRINDINPRQVANRTDQPVPSAPKKPANRTTIYIVLILIFVGMIVVAVAVRFSGGASGKVFPSGQTSDKIAGADFTLSHSDLSSDSLTVISDFEDPDDWQGDGIISEDVFYDGDRSISLMSTNNETVSVDLTENLDLSSMELIELMVYINNSGAFESMYLDFGDLEMKNYFRYSINVIEDGWNSIVIRKDEFSKNGESSLAWSDIERVNFSVTARPTEILKVNLDTLQAINNEDDYLKYWHTADEGFLSLARLGDKVVLAARQKAASLATLQNYENEKNFELSASVMPQAKGRYALFVRGDYQTGYGYYFIIFGDSNKWQVQKRNRDGWLEEDKVISGTIPNVAFTGDEEYWLKVEAKDNIMTFSYSSDNITYQDLGELRDSEFKSGGVGIAIIGGEWGVFNDFVFKRL